MSQYFVLSLIILLSELDGVQCSSFQRAFEVCLLLFFFFFQFENSSHLMDRHLEKIATEAKYEIFWLLYSNQLGYSLNGGQNHLLNHVTFSNHLMVVWFLGKSIPRITSGLSCLDITLRTSYELCLPLTFSC